MYYTSDLEGRSYRYTLKIRKIIAFLKKKKVVIIDFYDS